MVGEKKNLFNLSFSNQSNFDKNSTFCPINLEGYIFFQHLHFFAANLNSRQQIISFSTGRVGEHFHPKDPKFLYLRFLSCSSYPSDFCATHPARKRESGRMSTINDTVVASGFPFTLLYRGSSMSDKNF